MADLVLPNEGLADMLDYWLGKQSNAFADWEFMLWVNDPYTPSQTSVYADLTEATFGGYSRVTLNKSTWLSSTIVSNKAVSTWGSTPITYTCTSSPEVIQGYAIVTPTSPKIRIIQKWDYPITLVVGMVTGGLPAMKFTTGVP